MAHVSNLRLLLHPRLSLFPFTVHSQFKLRSIFTVIASRRHRNAPLDLNRRRRKPPATPPMEVDESLIFNKRRAEGRDKNDAPKKTLKLKQQKYLNPVNTISFLQILGTGMDTQDTSPSVLLFFDKQRFIFNAGEGLQRFCTEHKIKLSKINEIFLSRVSSETAGGLPGLLLTLAGMGDEGMSVKIRGPSDLKHLVRAMKSFIPSAAMIHTESFVHDETALLEPIILVEDDVVKISAIVLQPRCAEAQPLTPLKSSQQERIGHSPETHNSLDGKRQAAAKPGDMSVVYVCELPEIKGKFDPEKAKALGLRPGPKYRELQLGNPVKSDRQDIMVYPSDVLDPSVPGPIVLLVDCPTESHLESLLSTQSLTSYYDKVGSLPEAGKCVTCIIHLSPASIVNSSSYQKWMKNFGSAQHIISGHEKKNVEIPILKASARIASRLNYLCPQFFPAPGFWSLQNHNSSKLDPLASIEDSFSELPNVIFAENLLKFTLRPYANLGLDRSCVPTTVTSKKIIDELLWEIPEVVDAAQHVNQLWQQTNEDITPVAGQKMMIEEPWLCAAGTPACLENIRRDDLEMVLLGTGSSQPSKYRNVSAIHINLFSKGGLLLDCGEGTLGQLKRRYGVSGADDVVRSLRCIWISHIHADHHTGLARILALRRDLLKGVSHEPMVVVGPLQLKGYLDSYQRLEDLDMLFLDCKHTTAASYYVFEDGFLETPVNSQDLNNNNRQASGSRVDSTLFARGSQMQSYWKRPGPPVNKDAVAPVRAKFKEIIQDAGLDSLISFHVVHCPQAFGVILKAAERTNAAGKVIPGWKIVYSGDTRPCPELVEASRGATVLIHEATFEDAMLEEAIAKNHSTTNEAIEMGNSADAYRIILTHFSQRYPKIPVFDETHMHKTCIAFDMMSINVADLPVLPKVLPYLKMLFRNERNVDLVD